MHPSRYWLVLLLVGAGLPACQPSGDPAGKATEITVYSGRSKALVDSLVQVFEVRTGLKVNVRYGTDAELLAALEEEGERSPADLFWANTTGALAEAGNRGRFVPLPDSLTGKAAAFAPSSRLWVPVTTRYRVLAYNTARIQPAQLPATTGELARRTAFKGRIGWTPTYSSFQDFITAMRLIQGEDTTRAWLRAMKALEPVIYPSNTPMMEALANGEIDLALTNHYYVLRYTRGGSEGEFEAREDAETEALEDAGPRTMAPVALHHFTAGDVGNLALVTGAGLLRHSHKQEATLQFLSFLLGTTAQAYAGEVVYEYPVVRGTHLPDYLIPADSALGLSPPGFDFEQLRQLDQTLNLLRDVGLL